MGVWWFGRILTFEVVGQEDAVPVGTILADASDGSITCESDRSVIGYAAYGGSMRAAVQPLIDCYALDLFDDGTLVRSPRELSPIVLTDDELGNSAEREAAPRFERERASAASAVLRLSFYDPASEFQSGEARASAGEGAGAEERLELPAVVTAEDAKSLVHQLIARRWAERDRLTLRLAPSHLDVEPGREVEVSISPHRWTVEKCTLDAFVMIAELRPSVVLQPSLPAASGRIVANPQFAAAEMKVALVDAPDGANPSGEPTMLLAASSPTSGWRRQYVEISYGGRSHRVRTACRKSVLGRTTSVLGPSGDCVEVELYDADQWLVSARDDDLKLGDNLAALGGEFLQFGEAVPLGGARFRLSRLLRGRHGTKDASHAEGESFVLIERDALQPITFPPGASGTKVSASAPGGIAERKIPSVNREQIISPRASEPDRPNRKRRAGKRPSRRAPGQ